MTAHPAIVAAEQSVDVPTDAVYDILSPDRRRAALQILGEADRPLAIADLVRDVAARRSDDPEAASDEDLDRVAMMFHHVDVPKLEAADVVAVDESVRTVALTAAGRSLRDVLATIQGAN